MAADDPNLTVAGTVHEERGRSLLWVGVAAVGLAAALILVLMLNLPNANSPETAAGSKPDSIFPSEIAGMPVVSVERAGELLSSGKLDGQAVAIAGYYGMFVPSCPFPGRYVGPLESWCRFVAFADARADARLCQQVSANGTSCHGPTGPIAPFFVTETSGNGQPWLSGDISKDPVALVLIGHAKDPRQWQCPAGKQAECATAFVVDRIAWADGHDVPIAPPPPADQQTGASITPKMALDQAAAAAGIGADTLLTGGAFRAGDIATIDPRWNRAGDDIVWLLRSIGSASAQDAQVRPVTVWLVDDATGKVIDSKPLQTDETYEPAKFWQVVTIHGQECCPGGPVPFYRVTASDGTVVHDGLLAGGSSGDQDSTTVGGGYGSLPLVLPAGSYAIDVWLAPFDRGVIGPPGKGCSTTTTLGRLANVALEAVYPAGRACSFQPRAAPVAEP